MEKESSSLGIEFGSTRIKAVLINAENQVVAIGNHEWENQQENGYWTYSLEAVWDGLAQVYDNLSQAYYAQYGKFLTTEVDGLGISAMMHGYLAFDKFGNLLVPFRTWRNNHTATAASQLSNLFDYNIPERWSIAHLYQAILDNEAHISDIAYVTTLAGYVHWRLTGQKVLGIGDASGMFPINPLTQTYDLDLVNKFEAQIADRHLPWRLLDILPEVLVAGEFAGKLTVAGARRLDSYSRLKSGIIFCPPEGDAGTGMIATNSIIPKTGNVSAGTSAFAMIVLEKPLLKKYEEIDLVTTPLGDLVAMVHANNCTSDINAWINLFAEFSKVMGFEINRNDLFTKLFQLSAAADLDCGGLLSYGYLSGENLTKVNQGFPLLIRQDDSQLTLANFMRAHLISAIATLKIGFDLLQIEEGIQIERLTAHGGYFKTKDIGQTLLAALVDLPIIVNETASEGGAFGMALLARYRLEKLQGRKLFDYLNQVFSTTPISEICASPDDLTSITAYLTRFKKGIRLERAVAEIL